MGVNERVGRRGCELCLPRSPLVLGDAAHCLVTSPVAQGGRSACGLRALCFVAQGAKAAAAAVTEH